MAEPRSPQTSRRSERSRRAILDAALELVAETGSGKLTIEAIAARAGVGKQTIYRWWPSKAAVLFDSFLALSEDAGGIALPDTGDLEADLKQVMRAKVDELNDPRYDLPSRALAAESQNDPVLAAELTAKVLEPQLAAYEERLRSARRAGDIAEGTDLRVALELLVGPLHHRWMLRTRPLTHAFADAVVEMVLRSLAPPAR
ncbi:MULTISPECIES: TetR/AcrR family transcriptional regulator [Streptomyces]|uniref:TetR/AcrR family transcriptional regulator n=2 Tax=Streptomyces TaxID=1883 RepID=A0A3R7G1W3_9ACTN|nr:MULTISPECIES: TetR/AcrR family transcriptional regulator [Streptomyces]KNE80885.1 TetR family transcriptional regulator [Streptomyces fradiae]OFA55954.1 TetR family transcriptional regulator [Streptomyces fradiae]PQM24981.1 TetR family transcriptional regulator [Streptomyces xinghaiensis]RKM99032.1 TetR/AcrR family transcriptional regulator [Streptomyces xinghaiensis]RNC76064.1 TetR/AcrR family transcriptional regulator [Streptomyces xinghaiensis]